MRPASIYDISLFDNKLVLGINADDRQKFQVINELKDCLLNGQLYCVISCVTRIISSDFVSNIENLKLSAADLRSEMLETAAKTRRTLENSTP